MPQPPAPAEPASVAFRETAIGVWPRSAVVRTEQTGTVDRLEREHTKAVREALLALHPQNVDAHETEEIAAVHRREWPDKEGIPGSGERARTDVLRSIAKWGEQARRRTFKTARTHWDDARKGWPAVRFNIEVTDPRVSEFYEYVTEPMAPPPAPELSLSALEPVLRPSTLVPETMPAASAIELEPEVESAWPSDPYGTLDLLADIGFPLPKRVPTPEDDRGAGSVPEPDPSEVPEGQMASDEVTPDPAAAATRNDPQPVVLPPSVQLGLFAENKDASTGSTPPSEEREPDEPLAEAAADPVESNSLAPPYAPIASTADVSASPLPSPPPERAAMSTTPAEEITQQRSDVPEIAEPPLLETAPKPPISTATADRTEGNSMATPTTTPSSDRLQTAAEAAVAGLPDSAEQAPSAPIPLDDRLRANAASATPEADRELPLWTGNDLPTGTGWTTQGGILYDAYGAPQWKLKTAAEDTTPPAGPAPTGGPTQAAPQRQAGPAAAYEPADLWAVQPIEPVGLPDAFERVEEAWADIVPPDLGTAQDLRAAVDNDLRTLEQQWQRTVPGAQHATGSAGPQPAAAASAPASAADTVNTALQEADRHAPALKDSPEWQQLQTVRGAAAHLWDVIKEKAGPYFERMADDVRVQGFWRTVSTRSCETIARCAQAGADRLRSGVKRPDLPTAEALLKVSDAALAYSSLLSERPDADTVAAAEDLNLAEIRQLRSTLRSNVPLPYATRDDAVEASREIARAFQAWAGTDMGKELSASTHRRVAEFREAWQQLPPSVLPGGPGPAAGPYSAVAEHAQGIVERAQAQPGRFAPSDLAALKTVADLAEHHGGRLEATLPPGLTAPATPAAAVQQSAPRPAVATPGPAARPGAPRLSA
ncbi:hypothetical protein [Streptomyces sp. NPDC005969]|uniref:hypothetical protein n=1 Tax=Streptomyces sp. NPDC005969 TaxID=3156722 RepID=UPI0033C11777